MKKILNKKTIYTVTIKSVADGFEARVFDSSTGKEITGASSTPWGALEILAYDWWTSFDCDDS